MAWKNFQMWRGRLPHWRADDVTYYATFSYRRDLDEEEMQILFAELLKRLARGLNLILLATFPDKTEMVFRDRGKDFTDTIEKAKVKAGKLLIEKSGERWPPYSTESFDRIIRDEDEYEETWTRIIDTCGESDIEDEDGDYPFIWTDSEASFQ